MTVSAKVTSNESATPEITDLPSEHEAQAFETKHVHDVYSEIAPHFSATRHTPWPLVTSFLSEIDANSLVADIGCGNGKYMLKAKELGTPLHMVGVDSCEHLTNLASTSLQSKQENTTISTDIGMSNALSLPFETATFDAAINIAVIHHFATRARRQAALQETMRILRPSGRALVYVWALERTHDSKQAQLRSQAQPQTEPQYKRRASKMTSRRFDGQDMLVPWHMRRKKEGATSNRVLGDWEEVHRRFYHVYQEGELEAEIGQLEGVKIVRTYYDHQNWCAIIEKL